MSSKSRHSELKNEYWDGFFHIEDLTEKNSRFKNKYGYYPYNNNQNYIEVQIGILNREVSLSSDFDIFSDKEKERIRKVLKEYKSRRIILRYYYDAEYKYSYFIVETDEFKKELELERKKLTEKLKKLNSNIITLTRGDLSDYFLYGDKCSLKGPIKNHPEFFTEKEWRNFYIFNEFAPAFIKAVKKGIISKEFIIKELEFIKNDTSSLAPPDSILDAAILLISFGDICKYVPINKLAYWKNAEKYSDNILIPIFKLFTEESIWKGWSIEQVIERFKNAFKENNKADIRIFSQLMLQKDIVLSNTNPKNCFIKYNEQVNKRAKETLKEMYNNLTSILPYESVNEEFIDVLISATSNSLDEDFSIKVCEFLIRYFRFNYSSITDSLKKKIYNYCGKDVRCLEKTICSILGYYPDSNNTTCKELFRELTNGIMDSSPYFNPCDFYIGDLFAIEKEDLFPHLHNFIPQFLEKCSIIIKNKEKDFYSKFAEIIKMFPVSELIEKNVVITDIDIILSLGDEYLFFILKYYSNSKNKEPENAFERMFSNTILKIISHISKSEDPLSLLSQLQLISEIGE